MEAIARKAMAKLGFALDGAVAIRDKEATKRYIARMNRIFARFCKIPRDRSSISFEVYDGHGGSIRTGLTLN